MAGRQLTRQRPRAHTNWMALVAIFVLTIGTGIAGAGVYAENFYYLGFGAVVVLAGVGCAMLALGDDGS